MDINSAGNQNRIHLFISYATEDTDLATWLTLKLISEGYRVWCDKFKLLGGESYPRDIDRAIRDQTFRFIALISHNSNNKPNPLKERTLALNVARERNENFIIPINVDGIKPSEINWMISDLTYIPFYDNWAKGLNALLKNLSESNTPKPLIKDGKAIAASIYLQEEFINHETEVVSTNILRFIKIPERLTIYKTNFGIYDYRYSLANEWAFYIKDSATVFAFEAPPDRVARVHNVKEFNRVNWVKEEYIEGIKSTNIVSHLLHKSINLKLFQKGLIASNRGLIYFPKDLLQNDNISFIGYDGKKTRVKVFGERSAFSSEIGKSKFYYHLAPAFRIRQDIDDGFIAQLSVRLYITDQNYIELPSRSLTSKNKKVRKSWQNHEWYMRHLAIIKFLTGDNTSIIIGNNPSLQIQLSADFIQSTAPYGINEDAIGADQTIDNVEIFDEAEGDENNSAPEGYI